MNTTMTTIGDLELYVEGVTHTDTTTDEGGTWITGEALVGWATRPGMSTQTGGDVTVPIGCWEDTDDDEVVWCVAQEGARAIASLIAGRALQDGGAFVPMAFGLQCEDLGLEMCNLLRDAATPEGEI